MGNIDDEILEYLYHNDDGNFKDISHFFRKSSIDQSSIDKIYRDLKEYIEVESIYNHRGIRVLGVSDEITKTPLLKARITRKGKEYYKKQINQIKTFFNIKLRSIIAFVTLLIAIITCISPYLNKVHIPNFEMRIKNLTVDTLRITPTNKLTIGIFEDVAFPKLRGNYVLLDKEDNYIYSEVLLLPQTDTIMKGKILSSQDLVKYYLREDYEINFLIKDNIGKYNCIGRMPFNEEGFSNYYARVEIIGN